jgi:adenylate kinase family enzyme
LRYGIIAQTRTGRGRRIVRIVVVGISGAGKTTLAQTLAAALTIPHIELDALEWGPRWTPLSSVDPAELLRRVAAATAGDAWVMDGDGGMVRALTWGRATHLVWLDYDRPVIMWRVIRRSLVRVVCRRELWSGNVERWRQLLRPSHPIRWAWSTWRRRRAEIEALLAQNDQSHLIVHRVRHPAEASGVVRELTRANLPAPT